MCLVCGLLLYWLCFVACRGWVTEGQLKKRVRVTGALFRDKLACLVEGLYVEHIRYIKTNNPQSAYTQHILHNRHEYGTIAETMKLLKPIQNECMLLPFEEFHIQSLHQTGKLIPEQCPSDPNPLFQLTFSHPTLHATKQSQ